MQCMEREENRAMENLLGSKPKQTIDSSGDRGSGDGPTVAEGFRPVFAMPVGPLLFCPPCGERFSSEVVWNQHLTTKKHTFNSTIQKFKENL